MHAVKNNKNLYSLLVQISEQKSSSQTKKKGKDRIASSSILNWSMLY